MTISSISPMASPANAYASRMKRQGQFNPPNNLGDSAALRFAGRHHFGSFDSDGSDDSFGIPSQYWADNAHDSDLEEKVAVPPVEEESETDTASLNSQRTRKRDRVWSFLSGNRQSRPSPTPSPAMRHDAGQRRWSLPEQPSAQPAPAQRESKWKRLGNRLLNPFRSRGNSLTQAAPDDAAIRRQLEAFYWQEPESSLSMAPSSASRVIATPPTSNDRRTSL